LKGEHPAMLWQDDLKSLQKWHNDNHQPLIEIVTSCYYCNWKLPLFSLLFLSPPHGIGPTWYLVPSVPGTTTAQCVTIESGTKLGIRPFVQTVY